MTDADKYPPNIQQLFAPKPPLLYAPPIDYAPENRSTGHITPLAKLKATYTAYITEELPQIEAAQVPVPPTKHQQQLALHQKRQTRIKESQKRQLEEWNDPSILQQNELEFMKDPYRTVFISRLDFGVTELELSKNFSQFGVIESIRIIRDRKGKSRGYGFLVFEKEADANSCVNELARTGIKIALRTVLVDIERGRLVRNWKPARLGGGLGGRHHTRPGRFSNTASAAASGRRLHISNNPSVPSQNGYRNSFQQPSYPSAAAPSSYTPAAYKQPVPYQPRERSGPEKSVRDKYAKYSSTGSSGNSNASSNGDTRSIRSIRQRE